MKISDLKIRLKIMNVSCLLVIKFYFYGNFAYFIIYNIIEPYQNYSN